MKKSDLIKELYDETILLERSKSEDEAHKHRVNCFELQLIIENWKDSYEKEVWDHEKD